MTRLDREQLSNRETGLMSRLRQVDLSSDTWPIVAGVLWRGALLGSVLFLSLTDDSDRNLRHNFISFIVAMVWCYYDGALTRGRWSVAWIEGLALHFTGVGFASLLILLVGSPLMPDDT